MTRKIYEADIPVSAESTDDILLEAARELYKLGEIEIVRKFDPEANCEKVFVKVRLWKDTEEKKKEEFNNFSTSTVNEYIEDEHNPNGIISKLTQFFG